MYSFGHSTNNDFGMKVETQMTMMSYNKGTSGILSKHKKRDEMFMAMTMKVSQNQKKHINYAGTWKRLFERDIVTQKQLQKEISYLKLKTGLTKLNNIELPKDLKLGYFRTDFEVNLTQGATDKLMEMVIIEKRKSLLSDTYAIVNNVFNQKKKSTNKLCKNISFTSCHKKMIKVTSTAIVEMWSSLQKMNKARSNKDWKTFTQAYARFGKFLMDNQLSFKAILEKLNKEDYVFKLNVLGEHFAERTFNL